MLARTVIAEFEKVNNDQFVFVFFSLFWEKDMADFLQDSALRSHTRMEGYTNEWMVKHCEGLNGQCLRMQKEKSRQGGLGVKKRNQKHKVRRRRRTYEDVEGHFVSLKMEGGSAYKSSMGHMEILCTQIFSSSLTAHSSTSYISLLLLLSLPFSQLSVRCALKSPL